MNAWQLKSISTVPPENRVRTCLSARLRHRWASSPRSSAVEPQPRRRSWPLSSLLARRNATASSSRLSRGRLKPLARVPEARLVEPIASSARPVAMPRSKQVANVVTSSRRPVRIGELRKHSESITGRRQHRDACTKGHSTSVAHARSDSAVSMSAPQGLRLSAGPTRCSPRRPCRFCRCTCS